MLLPYKRKMPRLGKGVFIAPTAVIIGDVVVDNDTSIWFNAVVRGDMESIKIGKNSNIQDNCTVHTDHKYPTTIGNNVTVGHNAIIHGCSIGDNVLIGMGSTVLNGAIINDYSVIAAGSTVLEKQIIGPHELVAGVPAVHKKNLPDDIISIFKESVKDYLNLSKHYKDG